MYTHRIDSPPMERKKPNPQAQRPIPLIGLTGGIACGKSTILRNLQERDVLCMDADAIYRELVSTGGSLLESISREFGTAAIRKEGGLNRNFLGKIVFNDLEALKKLNEITHPAILEATNSKLGAAADEGFRWGVFEAAILVEGETYRDMDYLVVVSAPAATRLQRIINRDGLSQAQAQSRIDAQTPLENYERFADYIIENHAGEDALEAASTALYEALVSRFGNPK